MSFWSSVIGILPKFFFNFSCVSFDIDDNVGQEMTQLTLWYLGTDVLITKYYNKIWCLQQSTKIKLEKTHRFAARRKVG